MISLKKCEFLFCGLLLRLGVLFCFSRLSLHSITFHRVCLIKNEDSLFPDPTLILGLLKFPILIQEFDPLSLCP